MTDAATTRAKAPIEEADPVLYEVRGRVAIISLNRPKYGNAQNDRTLYELDAAFERASNDDDIGAIILRGNGKHFSSGHDLGTPGKMDGIDKIERKTMWYDPEGKPDSERQFVRESELYLGLCRRLQSVPKPVIAAVQGACIAGGLMLAWTSDIIVASEDAYFLDPVVEMGAPGVEYFGHPFEMPPRIAREFLLLGEKFTAERAYQLGMINRLVPREALDDTAFELAERMAKKPRFALAIMKQSLNMVDDIRGKRNAMDAVFGMHNLSHAHNFLTYGTPIIFPEKLAPKKT